MNIVDLNLDMINLVKDLPEDCAIFYFLVGNKEDQDFLYAKGDVESMAEALTNLMSEHEDIEWIVKTALNDFQS